MPTLAGNKHLSIHFLPDMPRFFHLVTEMYVPNQLEMEIQVLIPALTQKLLAETKGSKDFLY